MRFFSIIGPLATLAAVVSTLAVHQGTHRIGRISNPLEYSSRGGSVIKRADPGMSFCTDADSQGLCYKDVSAFGTCVTVQDDLADIPDDFGNTVSSVSVSEGTRCILFRDARCLGPSVIITSPGEHDLHYVGFNDMMSSFRCEQL